MSLYNYVRRPSATVRVGGLTIGGSSPVRVQSMVNVSTNDIEAAAAQTLRIARAGGELVRLTTQGVREAENIGKVREKVREAGCNVPIVADVHFNPKAAFVAATTCDKVRINPGNFVDAARTFRNLTFTDEEYKAEIEKIRATLVPFLELCRREGTAVRLGVNHGSLSDRIMSRYGNSAAGMTESVMEFLRICREVDFNDIVISIKASNTCVMVETVRTLRTAMDAEDMHFPLHLGVTEAGDGEDGRIKSAVGIGTLLSEGLGDTIRVSLSEEPEAEIPVALALVNYITAREGHAPIPEPSGRNYARKSKNVAALTADNAEALDLPLIDASSEPAEALGLKELILTSNHAIPTGELQSWMDRFAQAGGDALIYACLEYNDAAEADVQLKAAADFGTLLLNGYADGILLKAPHLSAEQIAKTELAILQATRLRFTKTEYIACPGCGRTLFDLQGTLKAVKEATAGYPGLKIGVMGCIVNGPGEMADADYGYVGAAAGKVSLYKGKQCVEMNIPQEQAIPKLIALIESDRR